MGYKSNIYAEEVKRRIAKTIPKEHLKGDSCLCMEQKYNFIDGKYPKICRIKGNLPDEPIKWHSPLSLHSSQVMYVNFFKKFFENEEYEKLLLKLLREMGFDITENISIESATYEHRPDKKENTNLDFFMVLSDSQQIFFEIKYTEPEFGGISEAKNNPYRYANSWRKNYARLTEECPYFPSDLFCDNDFACVKGGILNTDCPKSSTCGIHNFYSNYQICRNIVYARNEKDIVVFLTPRENVFLNSGRNYIDDFAKEHNTKNIVNLYWEDVLEKAIELSAEYPELNEYMTKFKHKYFSEPSAIPQDLLTEKGFIYYFGKSAKENISTFYKNPVVNFRGKTEDTDRYFTEIISEWLIENVDVLNDIQQITRESSYKTKSHTGEIKNENSNRGEEFLAKQMFNQSKEGGPFDVVGEIIDYQTPLKNKQTDEAGKIDLLSYDGAVVRILELKRPDSEETMLRCVLEGYTYLKTVDIEKLLADFELPLNTEIKACPLVALDGAQHKEMQQDRPYLKKLMDMLDIQPIYYSEKDGVFVVNL